jgi:5-methylcytosine-specific restriction endonuclease McrA
MLALRPGRCSLASCAKRLTGRQTRWCSRKCTQVFLASHQWSRAQFAALRRDAYTCRHCGYTPGKRPNRRGYLIHFRRGHGMEVNHIAPLNGRGYRLSCAHHLENLETLCHECHVGVTNHQRQRRTA